MSLTDSDRIEQTNYIITSDKVNLTSVITDFNYQ